MNPNYTSPRITKIVKDSTDYKILESLGKDEVMAVDDIAEELGMPRGTIGGRLAILTDNGFVERERLEGVLCYSRLQRKRAYDPQRRWSEKRKKEFAKLQNATSTTVQDVTPAKKADKSNKFDEVIQALTKANEIDGIKQQIRNKLSEIDDLLAKL